MLQYLQMIKGARRFFMTVAEMIKTTRKQNNMTQEDYGLKFGVTRQTVSSWENGRSMPDLQMLIDICNTFHISLDKLLNESNDYVEKIDYKLKIVRYLKLLKYVVLALLIAGIGYGVYVVNWRIYADKVNRRYAAQVSELGFEKNEKIYTKQEGNVTYVAPNQKLAYLKRHFYAQTLSATIQTEDVLIEMIQNDRGQFIIQFERKYYNVELTPEGDVRLQQDEWNERERMIYEEYQHEILEVLRELDRCYGKVYSVKE